MKLQLPDGGKKVEDNVNEGEEFSAYAVGEVIKSRHRFLTHVETGEIWVYRDGYYAPLGEEVIREEVRLLLGEEATNHRVNEVVEHIRDTTHASPQVFSSPPPNLVCVKNGILDLDTGELRPHTPDLVFLCQIPVEWDPYARPDRVLKFLEEVCPDENDRVTLLQCCGYCLRRECPIQKALMLLGEGSNGKSTFLNLLRAMLGKRNVSGRSLQSLEENPFAAADLLGKLANICPDLPSAALRYTGTFKALTGGDLVKAEKKFRDATFFENTAKLIFSANRLPRTLGDQSDAFFRRWILITFPRQFDGGTADPHLLEKLTTEEELKGLLVFAVLAQKLLMEEGSFCRSPTTEELRKEYLRKSDPVAAFVADCWMADSTYAVEKKLLYTLFGAYCRAEKLVPVSQDTFFRWLAAAAEVKEERPRMELDGEKKRIQVMVGLKPDPERIQIEREIYGERYTILYSASYKTSGQTGQTGQPSHRNVIDLEKRREDERKEEESIKEIGVPKVDQSDHLDQTPRKCAVCGTSDPQIYQGETWVCLSCWESSATPPSGESPEPEGTTGEGELYTVEFLADYPGGLVSFPDKPIPKGTRIVLGAKEAGELKRRFGFVRVERREPGGEKC